MASLTQYGYAVALDRFRSFAKAAKASFVSQPTLSVQLAKLEGELGITLFDRSRKPVEPTADGALLLKQFRAVLRENQRVDDLIHQMRGMVAGTYRLGVIPTIAPYVLPGLLQRVSRLHPDVSLAIEEITTQQIVSRLIDESLDGGILATPLPETRISVFPICREAFVVYHSPKLKLPLNKKGEVTLSKAPLDQLLVMRDGHCLRTQALDLCALESAHQGFVFEAGSLTTLCKLVEQGPFFTILPVAATRDLNPELVKELSGSTPFRQIAIVSHRLETRRAIRDMLIEQTTASLKLPVKHVKGFQREPVPPTPQ